MSINRVQLLNEPEETLKTVLDGRQVSIWTALPGIITNIDFDAMTCEVQPSIQGTVVDENGNFTQVNLPLLLDVPIVFPSGGGFTITFPLAAGDEVLVVFSSRCIDAWWQQGDVQPAMEARMHDLSDGFAIPGPKSQPNAIPGISDSKLQIRTDAGTTYFQIAATGKMNLVNATTDLLTVLSNLQSLLNTFMTTLAGFSGGTSPVTQAMLQAPATAAETSLALVLTELEALLG